MKKIFLIIAIISVLFLAGCNEKQDAINKDVDNKVNEESTNEINNGLDTEANVEIDIELDDDENIEEKEIIDVKNQTINKRFEANGLVVNSSYIVNWAVGGEQYEGNVLTINIDSDDVKKFNSDFQEIMQTEINDDANFSVHRCKYYINDNILSVVVGVFAESGGNHLECVYNFDISTGKKINSEDILKYKNISEDEFKQKLPQIYTDAFLKQSPQEFINDEWKSVWNKVEDIEGDWEIKLYNKTISEIPTDINEIPVYLDYDGNLHILAGVEIIAGMDGIEYYDVSFEKNNEISKEEHVNPYMEYSPLYYYYADDYEKYIKDFASGIEVNSLVLTPINKLQILRNLPFAKKGHDFKNADLEEFFNNEPWYKKIEGKEVTLDELSSEEKKVISMIDTQINKLREKENGIPKYKYDSNKDIVYSFYTYNDEYDRKFDFPYINIDSDNINKLNEDIYNWAKPIIIGTYFECESAEYRYYLNNDILTVIIEETCGYGGKSGFHYNIDVNTGEYISNLEFLEKNDINLEEVSNLKDKMLEAERIDTDGKKLKDYYLIFGTESEPEYIRDISDELLINPEKWTLVYLDNEQNIHVILELGTIAGAEGITFVDCIVEF